MMSKLIISAALTGAATTKEMAPNVPITPDEIAMDVVACALAGAAVVHIHVRDEDGVRSMQTEHFRAVYHAIKAATEKAKVDVLLNLTTSGAPNCTDELRVAHLKELQPDMCSFDAGTLNWGNKSVFMNTPQFLEHLCGVTSEYKIKPEIEIFDGGMMSNAGYYAKKELLSTPLHFQFILGAVGGLEGTVRNLEFLHSRLPAGATFSVGGIGRAHMPMLLAALALGANGLRVGLEDNVYLKHGVVATNVQLVAQAVAIATQAGREIATAQDARALLSIPNR